MPERLFHLVTAEDWPAAGRWSPPSLAGEGFVHLSFAHQLEGSARLHLTGPGPLWLLEVDAAALDDALRLEASRDGMEFPHLYRPLERDELLGHWLVERDARGAWGLPELGASAAEDAPPRRPGAPQSAP